MLDGTPFTDVLLVLNPKDGIFDLEADGNGDLKLTGGFESAILCSLFSDRRAAADEVADPMKRRGWIGNLLASIPNDNFGSGFWLYEQARGTQAVCNGMKDEALKALQWLLDDDLVKAISASVSYIPAKRRMILDIAATDALGRITRRSYEIWQRTGTGELARNV